MLSISVIVPVFEGGEAFGQCLRTLMPTIGPADEVIIVADGESDGSWRQALSHDARVLISTHTRGPAAARNLGVQAASGDVLFFIDADVAVKPNTLELVRGAFVADPGLAAVIGSYDAEPADESLLSQYRNLLHHFTHQRSREDAVTFWSACGAMLRDVFLEHGWFDERFERPSVEDIELGYRLNEAGYRISLRKDIQVKHLKSWSARSMIRTDLFARAVPWTELLLKYNAFRNDLNLRFEHRLSTVLVFALIASLVLAFSGGGWLMLAGVMASLLLLLNAPFYNLLRRKRGVGFTLRAIPWHWFFYAYSGVGFAIGVLRFVSKASSADDQSLEPAAVKAPVMAKEGVTVVEPSVNTKWAEAVL